MKPEEFCYWLQGLFELAEPTQLDAKQTDLVKRHLDMVFVHEVPPKPEAAQKRPSYYWEDGDTKARC